MPTQTQPPARLRSSLANAAWAVEERVVWGGADVLRGVPALLRGIADAIKWPFERAVWAIERAVIWPLEERAAPWDGPLRIAGIVLVTVAAIGAGVAGLLWAAPDNGSSATKVEAVATHTLPTIARTPLHAPEPAAPTLHGAPPVFSPPSNDSASKAVEGGTAHTQATSTPATADSAAAATAAEEPAGPAAIKVAHQFADAFVLYETGAEKSEVGTVFHATATPALAHSLLRRPPRLPANVKVPRAKVLNVVPGPSHNGVYTISVSLLRVGITSELRLDMQKDKNGNWQVTNVLG